MAVPERPGRACLIYSGVICETTEAMPRVSVEKCIDTNGFPANTMRENISSVLSVRNVSIVLFAASIRLGVISSASIDLDISRMIRMLCFSFSRTVCITLFPTPVMSPTSIMMSESLRNQSPMIRSEIF